MAGSSPTPPAGLLARGPGSTAVDLGGQGCLAANIPGRGWVGYVMKGYCDFSATTHTTIRIYLTEGGICPVTSNRDMYACRDCVLPQVFDGRVHTPFSGCDLPLATDYAVVVFCLACLVRLSVCVSFYLGYVYAVEPSELYIMVQ